MLRRELKELAISLLVNVVAMVIIIFAVYGVWTSLEMHYYGEVQHRIVDDAISIILIISLYCNYEAVKSKVKAKMHKEAPNEPTT